MLLTLLYKLVTALLETCGCNFSSRRPKANVETQWLAPFDVSVNFFSLLLVRNVKQFRKVFPKKSLGDGA